MTMIGALGRQVDGQTLSARLDALADLVRLGRSRQSQGADDSSGGFSPALLDDAESVLKRAGERLRLSGHHTVVALAGGTGSGKSTLFNALSGASFSAPGVTRPTTRHAHACVWGMQGAAPLLDWLGVQRRHRYARASVLDSGESDLDGLLLLDLPDHDSVVTASMATVDRLSKLADMVIWVLDPQKYADAAVHNRYLIPLAGHASVFTVVLNQIDVLPAEQIRDCEEDLRRLLDSENLTDTPVLPVSARTGAGLPALRALLMRTVQHNRTVTDRIAADIDAMIGGFAAHHGPAIAPAAVAAAAVILGQAEPLTAPLSGRNDDPGEDLSLPPWELGEDEAAALAQPAVARPPWEDASPDGVRPSTADPAASVPPPVAAALTEAFARAAGVAAVARAMASARAAQAARLTGWPVGRLVRRNRGRVLRAAAGAGAIRQAGDAAVGLAQQPEVDNAITAFADSLGGDVPEPWAGGLRQSARYQAGQVPQALADAVHAAAGAGRAKPSAWWRLIMAWQWLLTTLAVVGVALSVVIAVVRLTGHQTGVLADTGLIPWLLIMTAAMLLLGYLTAVCCRNMVATAAEHEREAAERDMRARVAAVTLDLVLLGTGREIETYERFRTDLAIAAGTPHP